MTKKQQQILALGVVMAIALVAGAYFLVIGPQLSDRKANQAATLAADTQATALRAQLVDLERKQNELPEAQVEMDKLNKAFPPSFEQDVWLRMVSAVANRTGVRLTSVTPSAPVDATAVDGAAPAPVAPADGSAPAPAAEFLVASSIVSINATGGAQGLAAFVAGLEQMERPILIDSVSLTFAGSDGTVAITGKTFLSRPLANPLEALPDLDPLAGLPEAPEAP